jgi:UDP-2-acetamido-3-amino-2,3-dideoxy-glucuronate N-acetyltransferase
MSGPAYFVHPSSVVDDGARIGHGTKIWHFCHVSSGAVIGERCSFGQNCFVAGGTAIGSNVKVQNNVSIYEGTVVEDDVFLGPSCVLTNVTNPRSQVLRRSLYETTRLRRGASIGANATVVCGTTIGRYAGGPARFVGWMSRHGHRLGRADAAGIFTCPESKLRYREEPAGVLRCLDLDEEAPLPSELSVGKATYDDLKR